MRRRANVYLHVEQLESRAIPASGMTFTLANGILTIRGTNNDDNLFIPKIGNDFEFISNGQWQTIPVAQVREIRMFGFGGNDQLGVSRGIYIGDPAEVFTPVLYDGGAGNDTVRAGAGNDTIRGGIGNDLLFGFHGVDSILGGDGNDTIYGERHDDYTDGEIGNDLIYGSFDPNDLTPSDWHPGNNFVSGGAGGDTLFGGSADDRLFGGANADLLYGDLGNDELDGGDGNDGLAGQAGNDSLLGGSGSDALNGGSDADLLDGGIGSDSAYGQGGSDTIYTVAGEDFVDPGDGNDTVHLIFDWKGFTSKKGAISIAEPSSASGTDTFYVSFRVGTFLGDVVNTAVAKVKSVTKQFQPLLNLMQQQVPVVKLVDKRTYADLLFAYAPQYRQPYELFKNTVNIVNALPRVVSKPTIDLGTFQVSTSGIFHLSGDVLAATPLAKLRDRLLEINAKLTFVTDPSQVIRLALGRNVSLFELQLPTLNVGFYAEAGLPIPSGWSLLSYELGYWADIDINAGGRFGYDLSGVWSGNPINGFYVQNVYAQVDVDIGVYGGAEFGVGPFEMGSVFLRGSVNGTVRFDLIGPNASSKIYFRDLTLAKVKTSTPPLKYSLAVVVEYRKFVIVGPWKEHVKPLAGGYLRV